MCNISIDRETKCVKRNKKKTMERNVLLVMKQIVKTKQKTTFKEIR